jgi:hypothetical protein
LVKLMLMFVKGLAPTVYATSLKTLSPSTIYESRAAKGSGICELVHGAFESAAKSLVWCSAKSGKAGSQQRLRFPHQSLLSQPYAARNPSRRVELD